MIKFLAIGESCFDMYTPSSLGYPGGNSLNAAMYAAMNGCKAGYIGILGKDRLGELVVKDATEAGVDVSHMRYSGFPTASTLAEIKDGERTFLAVNLDIAGEVFAFDDADLEYIRQYDVFHTSRYSNFAPGELEKLAALGIKRSCDFSNDYTEELLQERSPLMDYSFISASHLTEQETTQLLKRLVQGGTKYAVATRGIEGSIFCDGRMVITQKAYAVEATDTMGAGDSFITRFLLAHVSGMKLLEKSLAEYTSGEYNAADIEEYKTKLAQDSLSQGALFASMICQTDGSFGKAEKFDLDEFNFDTEGFLAQMQETYGISEEELRENNKMGG